MDAKTKLIRFMELKAQYLSSAFGISPEKYFREEDRKAILSWDQDRAQTCWEAIAFNAERYEGLGSDLCPFCIYHQLELLELDCDACEYAKHHGACPEFGSDWNQITSRMKLELGATAHYRAPSNEVYREILSRIFREEKGGQGDEQD